jgi:hypothetical protein
MALDSYTNIKTATLNWMKVSDITVGSSVIDDWIGLMENDVSRDLRVRPMETQTAIGITSGYIPHPADWRGWKTLKISSSGTDYALQPYAEEQAVRLFDGETNALPLGYVVRGSRTYVHPGASGSYSSVDTVYYAAIPGLSSSNTSNWLLTSYPKVYLAGMLAYGYWYYRDSKQYAEWLEKMYGELERVKLSEWGNSYSGGVPAMTPDGIY